MKHFGRQAHKTHVQRHFDPKRSAAPWYAWCETHGRLGKNVKSPEKGSPFCADVAEACERARAHVS